MSTRVWFENDAIQMDGVGSMPARSLYTVLDGDRVHIRTLSDVRLSQLVYTEYAKKDGSGFASASAAKTYLDGEFNKAPAMTASWDAITSKPSSFPPSAHSHPIGDVTGLQSALDGKQPSGSYAPLSHVSDTTNPHGVTKAQVGLSNVDNTSDAAKPVSTAAQTALNGKANTSHTHAIGDVTGLQAVLDGKLGAAVTPSTPTRALNTAFQPSATKPVLCLYSVKTQVTNPLVAGTSTAVCQLLSDSATNPITERGRVEAGSGVGISVTIALTTYNTAMLVCLVPAGHYVKLASSTTGTGAVSILSQTEIALG